MLPTLYAIAGVAASTAPQLHSLELHAPQPQPPTPAPEPPTVPSSLSHTAVVQHHQHQHQHHSASSGGGASGLSGSKPCGFSTQDKFDIVDLCFRTYTTPAPPSKSLKCADFYPLFFAATPPSAWLSIAWIGRRIHRLTEEDGADDDAADHSSTSSGSGTSRSHSSTSSSNALAIGKRKADGIGNTGINGSGSSSSSSGGSGMGIGGGSASHSSSSKRNRPKKDIAGVQLIEHMNLASLSKDAMELKRLCEQQSMPFISNINDARVQTARNVIDLYYSVVRGGLRKVPPTSFSSMKETRYSLVPRAPLD